MSQLKWRFNTLEGVTSFRSVFLAKAQKTNGRVFDVQVQAVLSCEIGRYVDSETNFAWAPVPESMDASFDKTCDLLGGIVGQGLGVSVTKQHISTSLIPV